MKKYLPTDSLCELGDQWLFVDGIPHHTFARDVFKDVVSRYESIDYEDRDSVSLVLDLSKDINSQENTAIIKRVVGVGGDTVEILENGEVFVNNSKFTIFNIDEGVNFKRETFLIPENEIFVLGDNRPNSQDSRYIGTIPMGNIIGKATHLIYPIENFKKLDDWR